MKPTQHHRLMKQQCNAVGFTLIEMVMVLVLIGILSIYAVPNILSMPTSTLDSQAKSFASDLRRTQLLASVRGTSLCVLLRDNSHYSVVSQCAQPSSEIIDPATGLAFRGQFQNGVVFKNYPNLPALEFNSLGQPNRAASYVIAPQSGSTASVNVNVTALTGYVSTVTNP